MIYIGLFKDERTTKTHYFGILTPFNEGNLKKILIKLQTFLIFGRDIFHPKQSKGNKTK